MTIYVMFRIIGWFLILVLALGGSLNILSIEKERKPLSAQVVLISTFLNLLTIWFIYRAMQI